MLKLNQLQIDPYLTVGDHFRFLGCKTAYVYEKGQATNKVKGYRCQLALVDRGYETFYVTVPTAPEIPVDTPVRVTDLEIKAFIIDGKPRISAKATAIEPIKDA
ncbi:hypothetical protein DWZ82_13890 [Butyricicoccus sp. AF35-5AC]|uniref:hypothetical protein n=1 Tax=Butyricicoccus sp. AF35-5AC TaxID=2292003 RepID=UPI000E4D51A0|nr:hypothetical protein [Butyricicoccus sp. AF35-5AC]RHP12227.1 hypothetical protein DWZ82_13890 [Butyricicoccus sp. AF35-5AC]